MAEQAEQDGQSEGTGERLVSALKSKEVLVPAALSAAGAIAAAKGPDLLHKLTEAGEQKGEEEAERLGERAAEGARNGLSGGGGLAGKVLSKLTGGGGGEGGGDGGGGGKKTRRLPIQRWTDVAVPVDQAYEAWLKFDQYPKFMHRVLSVEQEGDEKVNWQEKIWFSKRQWEGQITDRRKNDRIAWKTTSGMSHKGVVSFHKLDDKLTRVMVDMEFEPNGMIEKMASGLRFVKRAVQSDLARFKAYVELQQVKGIDYHSDGADQDADEPIARERRNQPQRSKQSSKRKTTSRRGSQSGGAS